MKNILLTLLLLPLLSISQNCVKVDSVYSTCKAKELNKREPQVLEILKENDGSYKYSVLFENKEKYDLYVPDDNTAFGRIESVLPN